LLHGNSDQLFKAIAHFFRIADAHTPAGRDALSQRSRAASVCGKTAVVFTDIRKNAVIMSALMRRFISAPPNVYGII
jgi:hypothetical protein